MVGSFENIFENVGIVDISLLKTSVIKSSGGFWERKFETGGF